jgi:hypothetical protein
VNIHTTLKIYILNEHFRLFLLKEKIPKNGSSFTFSSSRKPKEPNHSEMQDIKLQNVDFTIFRARILR